MPPTGSTRPDSVISPVIATSGRTGTPRAADTIAVAIVTPADGPSFGIAPAGTWMCRSCLAQHLRRDAERRRLLADVAERGARRFLHDAAELSGQREVPAAAGQQHRFDEEHVAARLRSTRAPVATPGRDSPERAPRTGSAPGRGSPATLSRVDVGRVRGVGRDRAPRPCARSCRSAARASARRPRACTRRSRGAARRR